MLRLYSMLPLLFIEYNLLLQLELSNKELKIINIIFLIYCTLLSISYLFSASLTTLLSLFGLFLHLLVSCGLYLLLNCSLRGGGLGIFQPMALFMSGYLSGELLWKRLRKAIFLKSSLFILRNLFNLCFRVFTNWYLFSIWLFFLLQNQHTILLSFGTWSYPVPFYKTKGFSRQ